VLSIQLSVCLSNSKARLEQISTGTGVAPFLQFICKMASMTGQQLRQEPGNSPSIELLKISLIQYLPRNSHASPASTPSASAPDQPKPISESLPVEEFDSTTEAGPDIIRHPDVLSPIIRGQLVNQGSLRLLRVPAGQLVDEAFLVDSLSAAPGTEQAALADSGKAEQTQGSETGSWFGWLSSSATTTTNASALKPAEVVRLQDGKIEGKRVGVMACLPVQ
jgi:hypothetical protein